MSERIFRFRKKPNTGSHSFSYNGNKYRVMPGEIVICNMASIGNFSDEYNIEGEIVDGKIVPLPIETEKEQDNAPSLIMVSRGGGYFNVINPDNPDKPLNDKGLRKEQAQALIDGTSVPTKKRSRKRSK